MDLPRVGTQVAFPWEYGAGPEINDYAMIMIPGVENCGYDSDVGTHTHWIQGFIHPIFGPRFAFNYIWDSDPLNNTPTVFDIPDGKICGEGLTAKMYRRLYFKKRRSSG